MPNLIRKKLIETWKKIGAADAARIAEQTPTPGVTVERGIPYLADGHPMHTLNVYYPEGAAGLLPTVVDIHGGGWMYGDRELNRHFCMFLAAQGYAVVGMSYRLLPETDLRGQVQDIFASLHWLEGHAAEHHCDLTGVFLTGDSAGGHLSGPAASVSLSGELRKVYGVSPLSFPFRAVAINHGACNVNELGFIKGFMGTLVEREMKSMLFGKRPKSSPQYRRASLTDTAVGITLPPLMLISSEPDGLHERQTLKLHAWLKERGIPHETLFWTRERGERLTHVFNITHPEYEEAVETNLMMLAFFEKSMKREGAVRDEQI
ncbi:MAG: alpha/beta hydrolase [Eubacteriales bacterium]|nr:alpha/beta hydrolase [Eubacteriales bacterium]